jgi:hypothetical protein
MSFCTAEWRICPQPQAWHRLWLELKSGAQARHKTGYDIALSVDDDEASCRLRFEPPPPNILAGWWGSSDVQKMETLRQQILWAAQHNVLDVADGFLRGLNAEKWHCAVVPSASSSFDDMAREQQERAIEERASQAENRHRRLAAAQAHRDRKSSIDRGYASSLDQHLIRAYRATAYTVFAEPEFALRIGERSAALANLFDRTGNSCAAYITAWNPKGEACDPAFNAAAQKRLAASVEELGLDYLQGEGRGEIGDWPPEESLLILGCTRSRAKKLGHAFKQNAVVWVGADAVPELIMLMPLGMAQSGPPDAA